MSDKIWVGTRKGLFLVQRIGKGEWSVAGARFLGDPVSMLLSASEDGGLLVCLDHGHFGTKVHRSTDGGERFEPVATPEYPERPDDIADTDPVSGEDVPWKLVKIWSMARGQDGTVWAGTIPGGLFRSGDDGGSWELVRSLWDHPDRRRWTGGGADQPGLHSICVDPRDPARVVVGVSVGGVWRTTDAGKTWAVASHGMRAEYMPEELALDPVTQDPHCVVQCPTEPDVFWSQHHNGIFKSTDGCERWTEITDVEPSTFGFPVAVHPTDGNTAFFVPAIKDEKRYPADGKVVVTRTRDGGESFEVLREGLPQVHAYDLVYRHAMDIDRSGDRLAFGSTTGGLWVTEDQGDRWHCVSTHLPPVYCVQFA